MYSTREALAYSGKLPIQQNPAAITPQLLDLLALQKVEADKKAAAQQLAMSSGQAQPTVAQSLQQRAMNSARQEVAQKMGLAGLSQEQPPAGPMPQGLMGAPTNLPTEYKGGGIIAFAQGGSGGDAHGRYRQQVEELNQEDVPSQTDIEQPPEMSPENAEFIRQTQAVAARLRDQDPEAAGRAASAMQQEMLSPNREAAIARMREQQAGLKALYERQKAERPSGLQVLLERMGQNINAPGGFGAAMQGVSQAGQAAREGYTKQEITQLNALSAIDEEIDKAIAADDVDKYNAYVTRRKDIEGQVKSGLESSTSMSDVLQRTLAGRQSNFATVQQRRESQRLEDERKRELANQANATKLELAAQAEATKRELANDRLLQLQIANINRLGTTEAAREANLFKLRLDAYEKAQKLIAGNVMLAGKSPEDQDAMATQMADSMIRNALAKPSAASASPTTRLKFDAQGNQIK